MTLPLTGLTLAVTRPAAQCPALAAQLAALGATPLLCPLIAITPTDPASVKAAYLAGGPFDLAVFISPNAAECGLAALADLALPPRLAAVGPGSAGVLAARGCRDVLLPQQRFDSEALAALPELQEITGWRVAIFRGVGGREWLAATLAERGATPVYLECYRRGIDQAGVATLQAAWATSSVDGLIITSSEALDNLLQAGGAEVVPHLATTPVFVSHPRVAATVRRLGARQVIETAQGDAGLVAGLRDWFMTRPRP